MSQNEPAKLCPAQRRAFDSLLGGLEIGGSVHRLWGGTGQGKTTVLRELHRQVGGAFLGAVDFVKELANHHPLALEDTFHRLVYDALKSHPTVIVDDVHLLDLGHGCHFYPRSGYFNPVMTGLCSYTMALDRKLVLGTTNHLAQAAEQRSYSFGIDRFAVADYEALVKTWLGKDAAGSLDFATIYRFAPKLNAHQLQSACRWLNKFGVPTTDTFVEYLRSQRLASNVDLGEVQAVNLSDLKGVEDVLRDLEINIVLPMENDELANRLKLRSKRGVLLFGPPGTGKTTVGRALAHRLKSKFFLIDGTFIAGASDFYRRIQQVFEAAKDNAPSVIFIDDADTIFEDGEERGLYRYLLTMLDGLESESAGRVCVMMTAMNVADLPPALVRSGRVELWLEMKLPDGAARAQILSDQLAKLPEELGGVAVDSLVTATEGFTGADLKRTIEDGKAIYAYDRAKNAETRSVTEYFLQSVVAVKRNKEHYAKAGARANLRQKTSDSGLSHYFMTQLSDMSQ
jgi:AAA+ superfamily predicted ATPase